MHSRVAIHELPSLRVFTRDAFTCFDLRLLTSPNHAHHSSLKARSIRQSSQSPQQKARLLRPKGRSAASSTFRDPGFLVRIQREFLVVEAPGCTRTFSQFRTSRISAHLRASFSVAVSTLHGTVWCICTQRICLKPSAPVRTGVLLRRRHRAFRHPGTPPHFFVLNGS